MNFNLLAKNRQETQCFPCANWSDVPAGVRAVMGRDGQWCVSVEVAWDSGTPAYAHLFCSRGGLHAR